MKRMVIVGVVLILAAAIGGIALMLRGNKGKNRSGAYGGELLTAAYSPGYSDMRGASHNERLERNDDGAWVIVSRDRESVGEPTTVTTYAVSEEAAARFEAFLKERDVPALSDRRESGEFATDYSPWSWEIVCERAAADGKRERDRYEIWEFRDYSEQDIALLRELRREFQALRGAVLSEKKEKND